MLKGNGRVDAEAIAWVIRLREADEEDWQAFTLWLEADPAHRLAYDEMALADEVAGDSFAQPLPASPIEPVIGRSPATQARVGNRRGFLSWGIAASLLLVTTYGILGRSGVRTIETGAGERRELALGDGSRIQLNGGTRLLLDDDRPRFARLERGEALFRIVHDPSRPFEVESGEALLRDMGTVFNVVQDQGTIEVAVSEGAVDYVSGKETASLQPGMAARKAPRARLWVGAVDRQSVGAWNEGRLVYSAAPVSRVAADLSRNLGIPITASRTVAERPFSGTIMLDGSQGQVLERAAAVLGLRADRSGKRWLLTSGASATD